MTTKLSAIVALGVLWPVLLFLLLEWRERRRRTETEKPPQEEKLLRPPGYSLAAKAEELWDACVDKLLAMIFCGSMTGIMGFEALALLPFPDWRTLSLVFLAPALAFTYLAFHQLRAARKLLRDRRNHLFGLRGEQAVAEALTEVASFGYRTFHDLPGGEQWNVDHVVVGPPGVFVIETKARRRRVATGKQPSHKVLYDADTLIFPTGEDREAIPQARRNAKWVAEYLTKKTGEPVDTAPVVVLPGWYVERASSDTRGIAAMNATYLKKYLTGQPSRIQPAQVRRIIAALEDKCRDVEF